MKNDPLGSLYVSYARQLARRARARIRRTRPVRAYMRTRGSGKRGGQR
jgi:hypothetical protein